MGGNLSEFSDRYLACRARADELSEELKGAKSEKDAAEEALIDAMVAAGITSFKTDDGVGLRAQREAHWSCPAAYKDALYAELRADPNLQTMFTVQPQTLNKFAKDMVEVHGEIVGPYADWLSLHDPASIRVDGFKKWKGGGAGD